jgi:sec-independent protein translocase protein TatB
MFDIGMGEICTIFIIAMLILGPKQLQEFAKNLGRAVKKMKNITNDIKEDFLLDLDLEKNEHPKKIIEEALKPEK